MQEPLVTNHAIKAVIFDLGNVLLDFDHTIAVKKISRFSDKNQQEIFELFFDSELVSSFEEGRISPGDFFIKIKELLNLKLDYSGFVPIWNEIFLFSPRNHAVYELAKALKRNYRLALLSNINILHFEYLKKRFPIFDAFHYIVTSFEIGAQKPHPRIYQETLKILEAAPYEVFYTDDRPELIESSRAQGIRGFVFKNVEKLKQDLIDSGVNITY